MSSPFVIHVHLTGQSGVFSFEIHDREKVRLWDLSLADLLYLEFEIQRTKQQVIELRRMRRVVDEGSIRQVIHGETDSGRGGASSTIGHGVHSVSETHTNFPSSAATLCNSKSEPPLSSTEPSDTQAWPVTDY